MRFKRIVLFLVVSLLLCETSFLYERHEVLRNIGNKFIVVIEHLGGSEAKIGLTEERLRTIAELRLRKEGMIIVDEASREIPFVYVNVIVVGTACNISLRICEWVELKRTPPPNWIIAIIWIEGMTGNHAGDPEVIVSSLNKLLDEFLNDYYKANPKEARE